MRKAFVPEFWITSDIKGDVLRTLIAVALHSDKNGVSRVKNDTLAAMINKDIRRIQADLNRGESLGLISRKFDEQGKRYFVINMNASTGDEKQHPMLKNDMVKNDTPRRNTTGGDDGKQQGGVTENNTPLNNPHIGTLYSSTVPLHSHVHEGEGDDLPIGQPKRSVIGIEVRTELAGWLMGDETKFISAMDCDWSDEIVLWAIDQAKKLNIRKAAYLLAICKNNWREGWCSPEAAEKAADEARRAKVRERMRNLK